MEEEKELNNISEADLWAMKTRELVIEERKMQTDPKYNKEDMEEMNELIKQAVDNMEMAIREERNEAVEEEGKTK